MKKSLMENFMFCAVAVRMLFVWSILVLRKVSFDTPLVYNLQGVHAT